MLGRRGATAAWLLWIAFAIVTWNVAFDRYVFISAARFTREQVQRYERGERLRTIEEGFTPEVNRAFWRASAWGSAVFGAGACLVYWATRRVRRS
jgi:hypothetical protein